MNNQKQIENIRLHKKWFHLLRMAFLLLITVLSMAGPTYAGRILPFEILPSVVNQGEVCVIRTSALIAYKSIDAEFRAEKIPLVLYDSLKSYVAILGIDLQLPPGKYEILMRAIDEKGSIYLGSKHLKVKKVHFKTQRLSLPPSMVDLDEKTLARVNEEEKRLQSLFQSIRKEKLWEGAFIWPLEGEITTDFGLRRIINQQSRSPHSGIDLRAKEGTPVLAANSGVAVLIDEFFFSGKSVILDHGWGIHSMYFHLLEALKGEGNWVKKGELLGRVGSTGRSTGPHLHWGIRIRGARVNPVSLIRLKEYLGE